VANLPEPVDIYVFVTPPVATFNILQTLPAQDQTLIWLQPGAANDKIKQYLQDQGKKFVADACIMNS
jgi:predicted CoA-binding protein